MNYRTARSLKKGDRVVLRLENLSQIPHSRDSNGRGNTLKKRAELKKSILNDGFINHRVYIVNKVVQDSARVYMLDVEMTGKSAFQFKYELLGAYLFERA